MKTDVFFLKRQQAIIIFLGFCILFSCKSNTDKEEPHFSSKKRIVYNTEAMEILGPDTLSSGWNTIEYVNSSNETHFIVFEKYPEGKSVVDTKAEVFPVFDKGMTLINEGNTTAGYKAFDSLPSWYFDVIITGGVGLTAPQSSSKSTIKLDPGTYLLECYVKMPNGKFHSVMGMYKEVVVTTEKSLEKEPIPTVTLEISNEKGIVNTGEVTPGQHIIKVDFLDQKLHEHFLGHDVHLVKLEANARVDSLAAWMNWTSSTGLTTPVPNGVIFMGGVEEMPSGNAGFFYANFTPGSYAFIAEVPAPERKGMLKRFTVNNK
ncbi:hypothetical protein [Aequorivita sp. Q41]|uniref:hypothetical protein n=1 Tax=Aequorivita sp. Q41 TaxID=3153300 RepID=UPI0032428F69